MNTTSTTTTSLNKILSSIRIRLRSTQSSIVEYAGFYPSSFEWPFYNRLGPSAAIKGETDDSFASLGFLKLYVGCASKDFFSFFFIEPNDGSNKLDKTSG